MGEQKQVGFTQNRARNPIAPPNEHCDAPSPEAAPAAAGETGGAEPIRLARRRRVGFFGWFSIGFGGVVLALALSAIGFIWIIQRDRNSDFLREQLIAALNSSLGSATRLSLEQAGMRLAGINPTFSVEKLAIGNPANGAHAALERADVSFAGHSLFRLRPEAESVRFDGLRLVLPLRPGQDQMVTPREALGLIQGLVAGIDAFLSSDDPTFRALTSIEGQNISVLRQEAQGEPRLLQEGLKVSLTRGADGTLRVRLARPQSGGNIAFVGKVAPADGGGRSIIIETENLTAGTLFDIAGAPVPGIDPALELNASLSGIRMPGGGFGAARLSIVAQHGTIILPDREMKPFDLEEGRLELSMAAASDEVAIDTFKIRFSEVNFEASGTAKPVSDGSGKLRLVLQSSRAELDRLTPSEPVVALDSVTLEGLIAGNFRTFELDRLEARKDSGVIQVSGFYSLENDGVVQSQLAMKTFGFREALRVWPIWIASNVRNWLVGHADGGQIVSLALRSSLQGDSLRAAQAHLPIPDEALALTYRVEGVTLKPILDAHPAVDVVATGVSSGRHAEVTIESGRVEPQAGQRVDMVNAKLVVANTALRPAILDMTLPLQGRLDGLLAFLSAPSLKAMVGLPADVAVTEGTLQAVVQISVPLMNNVQPKDTKIEFRGDIRQVTVDNIVRGERLEAGNFAVTGKSGQIAMKGEARMFGVANQIDFKAEAGKPAQAQVKATFDDGALAKRGIDLRPALTGSIAASFGVTLSKAGQPPIPIEVEVDLAKAKIETGIPGFAKRAGQPGRARFAMLTRPDGASLDNLELDLGTTALKGRVEVQKDGQSARAELSSLRISPGDNARVTVDKGKGLTRVTLRGNSFDMRPFLRGIQSGKLDDSKAGDPKAGDDRAGDLEVDLQSTVLVGFQGELMSAAELKFARRQGRLTQLALKAQFDAAPFTIVTKGQAGDAIAITADTSNGGALARFLDLYPRIIGGRLVADLSIGAKSQQGVIQMRDFLIRDEPSLKQVQPAGGSDRPVVSTSDEVQFTKFRADFTRTPGRLDLKEAVMWGGQIGGTLEGAIDYARDQVSLKGIFVPAYGLNNLFAQMPVLGPILGGGQYEGLFAVPFVITGKASAPVFRTNPVSAIAPGFLRKFFEIQREGRQFDKQDSANPNR